jgi:hypothetical protein
VRIEVITCDAYSDAWKPFFALFHRFWPDCPYPVKLRSDNKEDKWCSVVLRCATEAKEPILMMMEDFFINEPVQPELIAHALDLLQTRNAGLVRLYPANDEVQEIGDPYFAAVPRGQRYRVSCQASIWDPEYLREIARRSLSTTAEAGDFENIGGPEGDLLPQEVLTFKREIRPWPMEYFFTAINRGLWNPDALKMCAELGIPVDRSMRAVATT